MDSSCEGCYYNHTVTEKDKAILEECPKLNKYIAEQLKNNIGGKPCFLDMLSAIFMMKKVEKVSEKLKRCLLN